jgi:hypothetical protein
VQGELLKHFLQRLGLVLCVRENICDKTDKVQILLFLVVLAEQICVLSTSVLKGSCNETEGGTFNFGVLEKGGVDFRERPADVRVERLLGGAAGSE